MIEWINAFDQWLFYFINKGLANPVLDAVMPVVTERTYWFPVYVLLFVWLLWKGGPHGRWCALVLGLTIAIADPVNSRVLKDLFQRVRPCADLPGIRLLVPCGAGKSFPSSHAVNYAAAATVLGWFYKKWRPWVIMLACLVMFSRIYVGVHYPLDVIGGAVAGIIFALSVTGLWRYALYIAGRYKSSRHRTNPPSY